MPTFGETLESKLSFQVAQLPFSFAYALRRFKQFFRMRSHLTGIVIVVMRRRRSGPTEEFVEQSKPHDFLSERMRWSVWSAWRSVWM
jgi:uncharacterized protein YecE (DUF72 family)